MLEPDENIVLVTVATFPEAIEAPIFRNRLEEEGIPSVLADEQPALAYHCLRGGKLRVRQQDRERAAEIIAGIRGQHARPAGPCPVCQSDKIGLQRNGNLFKRVLTLFGIPGQENKRTCLSCGHEWQIP